MFQFQLQIYATLDSLEQARVDLEGSFCHHNTTHGLM